MAFLEDLGLSLAGSVFDNTFSQFNTRRSQQRAYQLGEKAADAQFARQLQFWNMQNQYNDPKKSYKRLLDGLKANGLNTAMALGSSASPNEAGSLSSVPSNRGVSAMVPQQFPILQNLLAASSIRRNDAASQKDEAQAGKTYREIELMNDQQALMRSQTALNSLLGERTKLTTEFQKMVNSVYEQTMPATVEMAFTKADQELQILEKYYQENDLLSWELRSAPEKYEQVKLQTELLGTQISVNLATALLRQHQVYMTDAQAQMLREYAKLLGAQYEGQLYKNDSLWLQSQAGNLNFGNQVANLELQKEYRELVNKYLKKYGNLNNIMGYVSVIGPLLLQFGGLLLKGRGIGRGRAGGSSGGINSPMFPENGDITPGIDFDNLLAL